MPGSRDQWSVTLETEDCYCHFELGKLEKLVETADVVEHWVANQQHGTTPLGNWNSIPVEIYRDPCSMSFHIVIAGSPATSRGYSVSFCFDSKSIEWLMKAFRSLAAEFSDSL